MRRDLLVAVFSVAAIGVAFPVGAQLPIGSPCTDASLTFSGTGIAPTPLFCNTVGTDNLILSATPRYDSAPLTTDNNGTFFAQPGQSVSLTHDNTGFADWNFDFAVTGDPAASGNTFKLFVDLNQGAGFTPVLFETFTGNNQDSSNEGYLNHVVAGVFNPFASGIYTIQLEEFTPASATVAAGSVAINVDVGVTATPEPASLALVATGLIGLGGIVRRRNKRNAAE